MDKRKPSLASSWVWCLWVLFFLLTGCTPPLFSPSPSPVPSEQTGTRAAVQVTADVLFKLVGTYRGSYQWHGGSASSPMRLEITQQEGARLSGTCTLGNQSSPLLNGITTIAYGGNEGGVSFTIDISSGQGKQTLSLKFSGEVTREGSMAEDVNASSGKEGTWSVKKG